MQAWEQFLKSQEDELGKEVVQKWLRTLKIQSFDACNLYLEAKDSFQVLWFEEHIRSKVQQRLLNGNQKKIKIHLSIAHSLPTRDKKKGKSFKKAFSPFFELIFDDLNPLFLLDNFVSSEDNILTHKIFNEISELGKNDSSSHSIAFNPVYIHGPSGTGKTHLLMALTEMLRQNAVKTLYVRTELFTDHVVSAIRAGQMSLFRQSYRSTDVLIVDDVHFFSRKGATQEEFFHTFNTLHMEGKQIVLSANCSPQELQLIEPRLISRFEWGIVLPLKPLHGQTLKELLYKKAEALQFPLPSKIAEFLLDTFKSNSKSLVKALEALILRVHLEGKEMAHSISLPSVKILLADLIQEELNTAITPQKIIHSVAEQHGIRVEDILGKEQTRMCVIPRQMAMYLCREELKMPYMQIGTLFSRDHSTVMAGVKQMKQSLSEDNQDLTNTLHAIIKKLHAH